ncbi:MAG TPA: SURF1 family protein [Acidimicrobiales bacterium]|nr:SURF1 family protein [Acidimicrobiales bacterium]
MYSFLRRPKYIAFTIGVILLIVLMVNLGFWQLRRLDTRKAHNAQVTERAAAAVVPLQDLIAPDTEVGATGDVQWRNAKVSGRYDESQQVLVRNRSYNGIPGYHVLTPLVLSSGEAVEINRGFVPLETSGTKPIVPPAPSGEVTVTGRVRSSQKRGHFGPRDPATGTLTEVVRADLVRLQEQVPYHLLPVYLELESSQPAESKGLTPIPLPELDDGPHLSYAIQWFTFSALAVVGWVVVVRKTARAEPEVVSFEDTAF